jgi:hypothetical protein
MKKVIRLTESDLIKIVKRVILEQTDCNKTFDELKKETLKQKNWTLKKTDGVWCLAANDFCTKDITVYGVRSPLEPDGQSASFERYDEQKNKIFFGYFNVGPGSLQ